MAITGLTLSGLGHLDYYLACVVTSCGIHEDLNLQEFRKEIQQQKRSELAATPSFVKTLTELGSDMSYGHDVQRNVFAWCGDYVSDSIVIECSY